MIFTLAPAIVVTLLIGGGIMFLLASADPTLKTKGWNVIKYAVLGYIIILSAWVLVNTFLNVIGVAEWTGLRSWWKLEVQENSQTVKPIGDGEEIEVIGSKELVPIRQLYQFSATATGPFQHYVINNKLYKMGRCQSDSTPSI